MNKVLAPSKTYLEIVKKESLTLTEACKDQLLILDLNGTLVSRIRSNKSMYVRPYSQQFFDYIFDNFTIMVWSSAQPHSVNYMSRIFGDRKKDISLIWDRTSFGLSKKDFNRKVTTVKDLHKVWQHYSGKFDATNTILLDDSPKKTVLQPYNAIHPTEFEHFSPAFVSSGESELLHVMNYLKTIQFQSNIASYIKSHPYVVDYTDKEKKNTYKLEFYIFADDFNKAPQIVDLQPKQQQSDSSKSVNSIITGIAQVMI